MSTADKAALAQVLREVLTDRELEFDEQSLGAFFVKLPGTRKLATMTWLVIGEHSLQIEAFFCRKPDENEERFWRWLLERNAKLYAVAFSVDVLGDVYLTGRLPLSAVEPDELDRVLGAVLTASDESFDAALEIGFRTSIEKEWDWRVKRGESLANLQAFAHFAEPANRPPRLTDDNP
ncbi:MAG TPA: YbjN domain-containing protein [Mycobacteriales bacterium]|nr:YbjN domain-containing protein [Mycobacteriales bacterium]HVY08763.1 YbjN domain-containing protein [Mycobacteriales bacterium]